MVTQPIYSWNCTPKYPLLIMAVEHMTFMDDFPIASALEEEFHCQVGWTDGTKGENLQFWDSTDNFWTVLSDHDCLVVSTPLKNIVNGKDYPWLSHILWKIKMFETTNTNQMIICQATCGHVSPMFPQYKDRYRVSINSALVNPWCLISIAKI